MRTASISLPTSQEKSKYIPPPRPCPVLFSLFQPLFTKKHSSQPGLVGPRGASGSSVETLTLSRLAGEKKKKINYLFNAFIIATQNLKRQTRRETKSGACVAGPLRDRCPSHKPLIASSKVLSFNAS